MLFFNHNTRWEKEIQCSANLIFNLFFLNLAQSVTCLTTDASLTADPGVGVTSSIPARSHTFVEIDHEIISTVILLPSADSSKKDCCHLKAKVCVNPLFKLVQEKV